MVSIQSRELLVVRWLALQTTGLQVCGSAILFVCFVFIEFICENSLSTEAEECGSTRRLHMNFESKSNLG